MEKKVSNSNRRVVTGESLPLPIQIIGESDDQKEERMDRIFKRLEGSVYVEDMFNHCENNDSQTLMESLNLHFKSILKVVNIAGQVAEIEGLSRPS